MLISSKAEFFKIPYPLWPHWSKMASMVGFVSCSKTVYFKFEGCDVALQWIRAHVPLSCQKRNKAIFYESCQIVFNNEQRDLNKEMLRPICTLIRIFLRFRNVQKFCHRLMIMIEIQIPIVSIFHRKMCDEERYISLFEPSDFRGYSYKLTPCPSVSQSGRMMFFLAFLQNGTKDLPNFLHEFKGQQGPSLNKIVFLQKNLNPGFQGIKCPKKCCFFTSLASKRL